MKGAIKYILASLILVTVVCSGIFYYISTNLSNEKIKASLISTLEDHIHGADVSIGRIDYRLGASIRFEIQDLNIKRKEIKPIHKLLFIRKATARIPIWSIFFKGATIDIAASSPQISYYKYKDGSNNWTSKKKKSLNQKTKSPQKHQVRNRISLPVFLSKSKINIRSDDITIFYNTNDGTKGNLTISKFLIKNISLKEPIAFEIRSLIDIAIANERSFSGHLLLVGELDIPIFLREGLIKSKIDLRLTNNQLSGSTIPIPNIRSEIILSSKTKEKSKEPYLNAELKCTLEEISDELNANVIIGKTIEINEVSGSISILEIGKLLKVNTKHFDFDKSKIEISGAANLFPSPSLDLNFQATNNIKYTFFENPIHIGISARLHKQKLKIELPLETLSGTGTLSLDASLPNMLMPISLRDLSKVKLDATLDRIKLTEDDIQKIVDSNPLNLDKDKVDDLNKISKPSKRPASSIQGTKSSMRKEQSPMPSVELILSGEKLAIGKSQFNLSGLITAKDNTFSSNNLSLKTDSGHIKADFVSKKGSDSTVTQFDISMNKIPFKLFRSILPKDLKKTSGLTDTRLNGTIIADDGQIKYDISMKSSIQKGALKNFKIKNYMTDYIEQIPILNKKLSEKDIELSNSFKQLTLLGQFKEDHYQLSKISFTAPRNRFHIRGRGELFPLNQKKTGSISLSFKDNTGDIGKILKKHTGTNGFPIYLQGTGLSLEPNYRYTIEKISKLSSKLKIK
ncbi:MAG: hypothetical protein OXB88_06470 [Bacteriovoracales bacterium]|nr:hypothetical protein [Bacteriovoracales bacterium]